MKRKLLVILSALVAALALAVMFSRSPDEGITPLMIAAKGGDIVNVERILLEDVDLDHQSAYGWTALMFASWQGHENVVRSLVEAGADINSVSRKIPANFSTTADYPETTAIFEAISNRHYPIAFYFLEKDISVNASALAVAGAYGTPELLKRLVDRGWQVNAVSDNQYYQTSLSAAARYGEIENMEWLLENGADPNLSLPYSSNLNEAIRGMQPKAVAVLLEAGANVNAVIGSQKTTAIREAIYVYDRDKHDRKIQIIKLLLQNGADSRYRPDERSLTLIEQVEKSIEAGVKRVRNLELRPDVRERYRRSLASDRTIINLLTSYHN